MSMQDLMNSVNQFHQSCSVHTPYHPNFPSCDRFALRYKLLAEELSEIQQAFRDGDITELADGLGDLLYVLIGTVLECGLHSALPPVLREIHRSNMTKFSPTLRDAQDACNAYFLQHGIVAYPVRGLNG
eukprot:5455892-Amphidinium_carterae.1